MILFVIVVTLIIIGGCIVSIACKSDKADITLEAVVSTYLFAMLIAMLSV